MEDLKGRLLLEKDVSNLNERDFLKLEKLESMDKRQGRLHCQRCGTLILPEWQLPDKSYYCRACVNYGRIRSTEFLYTLKQTEFPKKDYLVWEGQLTPYQETVSHALVENVNHKQNVLVEAVTGAGKTEMIYPLLQKNLMEGKSIAVVSPRIDVCIELHKRLSRDFSCQIPLLHGQSEPYFRSPLVIGTCHQLFKFYRTFDLVVIDEVDAFPYREDPILYHAVQQSLKTDGQQVFLTATSTDELEKKIKKGELIQLSLARRFHGNPLVIPRCIWQGDVRKNYLSPRVEYYIKQQRESSYPLLIFCPVIEEGKEFTQRLRQAFPNEEIGFVSSQSEERLEQVEKFRNGELGILVSTTILERGVTFPKVDVFIINAHHHVFTKSSLVQMSGRVGRSQDRPTGQVVFFHNGYTKAMKKSIKAIKIMNKKGGFE